MSKYLVGLALTIPGRLAGRVRAEALQRTETPERFVNTAVQHRLDEQDGLVVVLPKDLARRVKDAHGSTPVQYVIAAVKAALADA